MGKIQRGITAAANFVLARPNPAAPGPKLNPPREVLDAFIEDWTGGTYSQGIQFLSRLQVIRFTAARRCVELIANAVGSAPLKVYHRKTGAEVKPGEEVKPGDGRSNRGSVVANLIYRGLDTRMPNRELLSTMASDLAFDGSAYLEVKGSHVIPTSLELMQSYGASIHFPKMGSPGEYYLRTSYGDVHGPLPAMSVVHASLVHLLPNQQGRAKGSGPVSSIVSAVRAGVAGDEFVRRELDGEGLHNRLVYKFVEEADTDQLKMLNAAIDRAIATRSHRPLILQNMGAKGEGDQIEALGTSPLQASKELVKLREFQVLDVARAFGVPAAFLAVPGPNVGNALQEHRRALIEFACRPYMECIESALTYRLLRGTDYEVRFALPASLLVDLERMSKALTMLVGGTQGPPMITVNEGRELLRMPRWDDPKYDKPIDPSEFHATGSPPGQGEPEEGEEGTKGDGEESANEPPE